MVGEAEGTEEVGLIVGDVVGSELVGIPVGKAEGAYDPDGSQR